MTLLLVVGVVLCGGDGEVSGEVLEYGSGGGDAVRVRER